MATCTCDYCSYETCSIEEIIEHEASHKEKDLLLRKAFDTFHSEVESLLDYPEDMSLEALKKWLDSGFKNLGIKIDPLEFQRSRSGISGARPTKSVTVKANVELGDTTNFMNTNIHEVARLSDDVSFFYSTIKKAHEGRLPKEESSEYAFAVLKIFCLVLENLFDSYDDEKLSPGLTIYDVRIDRYNKFIIHFSLNIKIDKLKNSEELLKMIDVDTIRDAFNSAKKILSTKYTEYTTERYVCNLDIIRDKIEYDEVKARIEKDTRRSNELSINLERFQRKVRNDFVSSKEHRIDEVIVMMENYEQALDKLSQEKYDSVSRMNRDFDEILNNKVVYSINV